MREPPDQPGAGGGIDAQSIARLANELFAPSGVNPGASPFNAPLNLDQLQPLASIPLVDPISPVSAPVPAPAPVPSAPFQIDPIGAPIELPATRGGFDAYAVQREFPILEERVNGRRLVWLDNAATTQKPRAVIDRLSRFYEKENSNIHRAAHTLAARATDAYESARETVRRFIKASSKSEIIFVRGTTEGINLVARTWGQKNIGAGDEILLTWLEHHANIVPWQLLAAEKGATIKVVPVDDRGQIIFSEYDRLLGPKTKIVAFPQVSNALGTVLPAPEMIELAHRRGAIVSLDGAQGISHMPVDVQALDCDFYVFSGHKVFAPTGIGVVYGKKAILDDLPPYQGGGNMIQDVTFERTIYQGPPARFEAGTGNIADAIGLGAALDWLSRVGVENVGRHEHDLLEYATGRLAEVRGLHMIGTAPEKAAVMSFILDGQKTEEVGGLLDKEGIAVRSGHHCAQPILRRFGVEATVRASLAPYNTIDDIDALVEALHRLQAGR
jgi:cysteine desulfurase/selenocysteine lyase